MNIKNTLINFTLLFVCLFGIVLIFNEPIQAYFIKKASEEVMDNRPLDADTMLANNEIDASFDFDSVESLTLGDIFSLKSMASYVSVIGQIAVPSVNLHLPIGKGVSETVLATGAGTLKEDQQLGKGNYALASHNLEGTDVLFSPLHHAQIGDAVYLTDLAHVYTYEITVAEVIPPTATYVLDDIPNKTLLTLITCAFDGEERLHIQAKLTATTAIDNATQEMKDAFQLQQNHTKKRD